MARFRDIELEELPLEDIQGLGGELSPEMAALVERVGRSAEDVASRVGSRGVDVETLPVQDVSGVHADGRPFEGLPADDVEQADSGVRVSGERVEDPDEQVKRLVLKSIGDRQRRGDPGAEALRLATVEGQGRRRSAIEQARQDIAGADIGSDAWVAHLQRRAPNTSRREAAQARLSQLLSQDASAAGADGDQMAQYLAGKEKASRAEDAAMELAKMQAEEKRAGRDFTTTEREAGEKFRAGQGALDRQSRERAARRSNEPKPGPGPVVPGMDISPGAQPTQEDAKKVKASRAAAGRMRAYVTELSALHAKHGTEYGGAVGNRMQQLTEQIQLEGKNIAELGALSGPDLEIMQRLSQANPGGFWANLKGVVGVDNTKSALEGLTRWTDDQVKGTAEAYGYQEKPAQASAPGGWSDKDERRLQELEARARR